MSYQAFGLRVQSALPLPELRETIAVAAPDVTVALGAAPRPTAGVALDEAGVCAGPGLFWLEIAGLVRLLVRDGREIRVEPAPGAGAGDMRAYLLGSGLGAVLHQRGFLPLHASAVEINGRAVAFVAASGGGKSTIAMHLGRLGHRVLCDDIGALDLRGPRPRLWPGLRTLKLWEASLAAIERTPAGLEPVVAGLAKYRVPIAAVAPYRAYDLAAVVLLGWGDTPQLTPLPGAAATAALVANTFRGQLVVPMERQVEHWRQCLAVARATPVRLLTRPRNLAGLDAASAALIDGLSGRAPPIPQDGSVGAAHDTNRSINVYVDTTTGRLET